MAVVLTDQGEYTISAEQGLFVAPADAELITGWILKTEGMCQDDLCVPLKPEHTGNGTVDLAAFWEMMGHPVVSHDDVWVLGTAAESRASTLDGLDAPDFTLPDLSGQTHRLFDYRGQKIFLTTWASW